MKKEFEVPAIDIAEFDEENIVTASSRSIVAEDGKKDNVMFDYFF